MVCGGKLTYQAIGQKFQCHHCGQEEVGNIYCAEGHYICDTCHGQATYDKIEKIALGVKLTNPFQIAERLMNLPQIPMLGCENAWIATAALMAALRNEGSLSISDDQIQEALQRTRRQAIGGYCGLTGACGIPLGIGASFSVLLGAACPKDQETALTMRILAQTILAVANETGPCCCKNFVRTALQVGCQALEDHLQVRLPKTEKITCTHAQRHPHGCRATKCQFFDAK